MSLKPPVVIILGICWAASGCGIIENAARTLVIEPIYYCTCSDRYFSHHRHHRLAEIAWKSIERAKPSGTYSADYAFGFREGFADYLDAGPGNLPALPPRRYWKGRYQSPEGHQAILDWYGGFGHGARVAAEGGYRHFITLPTFLSMLPPTEQYPLPPVAEPFPEVLPAPAPSALPEPTHLGALPVEANPPDVSSVLSPSSANPAEEPKTVRLKPTADVTPRGRFHGSKGKNRPVVEAALKKWPPVPDDGALINPLRPLDGAKDQANRSPFSLKT